MEGQFFAGASQQQQQQQQQPFQYGYVHQQPFPYIQSPPASVQPVLGQQFFNPWEPPPPPVPPPADAELHKRIDKLVEFSAKNGPGFEALMRDKQKDNPAYAFLFGADGHGYYRYKLWITVNPHLVGFNPAMNMLPPPALGLPISPPPPLPPCPPPVQQVPATFPTYYDVASAPPPPPSLFIQPNPQHLFDPSMKLQSLKTVPPEIAELRGILDSLNGTKDSIRTARMWFMQRAALAPALAEFLRDRVVGLENVERQMHVLYLLNDILFTSFQHRHDVKELDSEALAFRPVLGAILGAIHQNPHTTEADRVQVEKMLQHWGSREVYDQDTVMCLDREWRAQNSMLPPSSTNVVQRQEQAKTAPEQKIEHPSVSSATQLSVSNTSLFLPQQASTSQEQQAQATTVRPEQAPYLHFPPGLIPGMVRKIQIGSGVPYSPLNPLDIPTVIPTSGSSESYIMDRVAKFFKDVGEGDSFSGQDKSDEDDAEEDENERGGARIPPPPHMQVDAETGTLPDGSMEHRPGMTSTGRLGLGAAADPNEATQYDDVYTSYRKQRSTNYHTSLSARAAAR